MARFTETPDWSALPAPTDDGAARHLNGMRLPSVLLAATDGRSINLGAQPGRVVVYAYPRTGVPDKPSPDGWDAIPGARGCTPQSCAFRDHYAELKALGARAVYGLSTQDTAYQREAAGRLHLPFPLLSDERLALTGALKLPTFQVGPMVLLKRLTLIVRDGTVERVFYPVFPPDRNAGDVMRWLAGASAQSRDTAAG
jgi:peroxiredoxin